MTGKRKVVDHNLTNNTFYCRNNNLNNLNNMILRELAAYCIH